MSILDVLNAPWAIEPSKLLELNAIYAAHLNGEKIDISAVEARLGRPLANEQQRDYDIVDGVAVITIDGVIAKKMNMFSMISGGASSEIARRSLMAAQADALVHSIILSIDSPGGTVDGTQTLGDAVFEARSAKPIVTLGGGMIASAAYWIGSAANAAYISEDTTTVGSIGVVTSHQDISGAEAAKGIKTTEISAGKYKRIASAYGPLSDDGRQSIQERLDYMYSLFVGAVARNRGVAADVVLKNMADGRVFIGNQAIEAGLVDGVMSFEALVAKLNQERPVIGRTPAPQRAAVAHVLSSKTTLKGSTMNKDELQAAHPELAEELRAEGAANERERIKAIEGQAIPGHEKLIATLKFDGKSTAGDAAMAVVAAEKSARQAHAAAAASDAPTPLPAAAPPAVAPVASGDKSRDDLHKEALAYQAAHPGTDYVAACKAIGVK
jgi:signal peptide peptidase SppA